MVLQHLGGQRFFITLLLTPGASLLSELEASVGSVPSVENTSRAPAGPQPAGPGLEGHSSPGLLQVESPSRLKLHTRRDETKRSSRTLQLPEGFFSFTRTQMIDSCIQQGLVGEHQHVSIKFPS